MKKGILQRLLISGVLITTLTVGTVGVAYADNDLNDIGNSTIYVEADGNQASSVGGQIEVVQSNTSTESQKKDNDNAVAIGDLFGSTKIDKETAAQAKEAAAPIIKGINWVVSFILAILSAAMLLITILDLLYIAVPFIRKFLDGGRADAMTQQGGMQGGMQGGFDGGFGGGYGGRMGHMGAMHGGAAPASKPNIVGRLVSDEAIAAFIESQPQAQGGNPMMGQPAAPVRTKSIIVSYFKKRLIFLVLMGVCIAVFATTTFTDLGLKLGSFIVEKANGLFFLL